jgi:halocyanin-like protein
MRRREFVAAAGGMTAALGAAGPATAQTDRPDFGGYIDGAQGGAVEDLRGTSEVTVEVGAGSNGLAFAPTGVWIDPETTITFEWVGPGHNIVVENGPSGTSWEGVDGLEGEGFTHQHTFETAGVYQYFCQPHKGQGMLGAVAVGDDVPRAGTGGREGRSGPVVTAEVRTVVVAAMVVFVTMLSVAYLSLKFGGGPPRET